MLLLLLLLLLPQARHHRIPRLDSRSFHVPLQQGELGLRAQGLQAQGAECVRSCRLPLMRLDPRRYEQKLRRLVGVRVGRPVHDGGVVGELPLPRQDDLSPLNERQQTRKVGRGGRTLVHVRRCIPCPVAPRAWVRCEAGDEGGRTEIRFEPMLRA